MILIVDNYDSFSYNLYQLIGSIDPDVRVVRNDDLDPAGIAALGLTLRDSRYKGTATLDLSRELVENALTFDPNGYRAQLLRLIRDVKLPEKE